MAFPFTQKIAYECNRWPLQRGFMGWWYLRIASLGPSPFGLRWGSRAARAAGSLGRTGAFCAFMTFRAAVVSHEVWLTLGQTHRWSRPSQFSMEAAAQRPMAWTASHPGFVA